MFTDRTFSIWRPRIAFSQNVIFKTWNYIDVRTFLAPQVGPYRVTKVYLTKNVVDFKRVDRFAK